MVPSTGPRSTAGGSGSVWMAPPAPSRTRLSATTVPSGAYSLAWASGVGSVSRRSSERASSGTSLGLSGLSSLTALSPRAPA